jgi:hypothetical protein
MEITVIAIIGGALGLITLIYFIVKVIDIRKRKELEKRQDKIERVLKEVALKNSDMAEILKRVGL